ncbi:ferredoxin [Streptococcus moroccensis]|uniref:Ferredoxin n=1 Tax=Streptococcus moroccensis TaxID=1451356 RepID=A0ABT9YV04_9STRE|nr:ferredoxin [Streptococcus moroccensis]MDQ0223564.1 ferredoxin [Streptococcus moroccensis]
MKVSIIPEHCIACGLCQTYSPVFDYDDDGIVIFSQSNKRELELPHEPNIIKAVKECPTKALLLD